MRFKYAYSTLHETNLLEIKTLTHWLPIPKIKAFGKPQSKEEYSNKKKQLTKLKITIWFLFGSLCLGICFNHFRFL